MIKALLQRLANQGVQVGFANEKLAIRAEKGKMTPEIMAQLKLHKEALIAFFNATGMARKSHRKAIKLAGKASDYPLSPAQNRLWLAEQVYGSSSTYHMPLVARLEGIVNVERLEQAINHVIEKHQILRTIYRDVDGEVRQVVIENMVNTLPFKLFSGDESELVSQVQHWVENPFKLNEDNPIRMALWQLSEENFVLLGCIHHIACDGWSLGILQQELAEAYNTQLALQPLDIQYKDYAVWCKNKSSQQSSDNFWTEYLADIPDVHQLPLKHAGKGRIDAIGAKNFAAIDSSLSQAVTKACLTLNVTPFVFYRSVFALLISRFSRQNDVVLGSPEAGRDFANLEPLIGCFINTLVFRHQFKSSELTVKDWLILEQASTLDVFEHKQLPFEQLPALLGVSRESRHHPIFQLMFSLQNTSSKAVEFDGFGMLPFQGDLAVAKFDITLDVVKGKNGYFCQWEYNKAIFSPFLIDAMSDAYTYLLTTVCANLDEPLGSIATSAYTPITKGEFNSGSEYFIRDIFSHPPMEEALIDEKGITTYGELSSKVSMIVEQLKLINNHSCVAIWQERNANYVATLLAIWCAGHVAVPLEKSLTKARLEHIFQDANIAAIVGDEPIENVHLPFVDINNQMPCESFSLKSNISLLGHFLIYTSGSTGKAKGVKVSCHSLNQHLKSMSAIFPNLKEQRILHFTNFSVDTALEQLLLGLMQGGSIIIKPDELWDSTTFWNKVREHGVTCVDLPPSYLVTMMAEHDSGSLFQLSTIEHIVLGGESFPESVIDFWHKHDLWQHISLWNAYGPTEATITATFNQVKPSCTRPVSLGQLLPGRTALVTDQLGQPLPRNISGELWLGGASLANGYINNPAQSLARFITLGNDRYYKTGDIVYANAEGDFYFKGREDNQVKVRGYRIELEEVEATLLNIDGIEQVAVILKNRGKSTAFLAAFFSGTIEEGYNLRGTLSKILPHYMVPKHIERVSQWPLLSNGKIDRKSLQEFDFKPKVITRSGHFNLPSDPKQKALAKVWEAILQVSDIDTSESFFAAGGDSISAIKLVGELARLGWKITAKDIFVEHNIENIARKMTPLSHEVSYAEISGEVPLLPIQQSFLEEQNQYWLQFNQTVGLKLNIPTDVATLKSIIKVLAGQHDVLRMGITQHSGKVTTVVHKNVESVELTIHHYTIDDFTSDKWQSILDKHQAAFLSCPERLWQLLLVEHVVDQQQYLVWICHHFIVDAVSWQILLTDFASMLNKDIKGENNRLPDKTAPINIWHKHLTSWGNSLDAATYEYWKDKTAAFDKASFSSLEEEPVSNTQIVSSLVPKTIINRYLLLGREKLSMTEQELLIALFSQAIGHGLMLNKLPIVMENQGRLAHHDLPDVSRTLGWFTATYPFVSCVSLDPIADLANMKDKFRSIPDQGVSFSVLNQVSSQDKRLHWDTHAAICFNYFGKAQPKEKLKDSPFSPANIPLGSHQHPSLKRSFAMAINCSLTNQGLQYSVDYGKLAFEKSKIIGITEDISRLAIHLSTLLENSNQRKTLSDFPLINISQQTLDDIIYKFDNVEALYPSTPMQHGMVYHALMDEVDVYVPQSHVRMSGELNAELFFQAWQKVIVRYQVLRSCFYLAEELVIQVVLTNNKIPTSVKELSEIPSDVEAYKSAIAQQGFDLTQAPLMRLDLVKQTEFFDVIWTHHHSILDGWSIPIIFNDLIATYIDLISGRVSPSNQVCHYGGYISWLNGQDKQQALDYWEKQLSVLDNKSDLGFERKAQQQTSGYFTQDLKCNESISLHLSTLAKKNNVTLNTLIQATWAWMLSKYSGEEVVCYGTTVSGRPNSITNAQDMVGLFINSLPVVTQVDETKSISDWLQSLQLSLSACEEYGYVPLTDIAATSHKRGADLFDTLFIFENYPREFAASQEQDNEVIKMSKQQTKEQTNYPLTIMVADSLELHIRIVLEKNKQTNEWLTNIRKQWLSLLENIVSNPWQRVEQWSIDTQQSFVSNKSNVPKGNLQVDLRNKLLHGEDNQFVYYQDNKYSYLDIAEQVTQLSGYLKTHNIKRIGLHLKRSEKLLSSVLACLISGTTFVPLDPAFPKERLKIIAKEAQLNVVINDCESQEPLFDCKTIAWTNLPYYGGILDADEKPFSAYIMFTSGSTGKPKGVEISIKAFNQFLFACSERLNISEGSHFLATTTYAFDISLLELVLPILNGANLTIASDRTHKNPDELIQLLTTHREINVLQGTPSFWRMLFAAGWSGPLSHQLILSGGEELTQDLAKNLKQHDATIYNCYGPTEATIWSMMTEVNCADQTYLSGSLSGYQHVVLDKSNHVLLPGMVGELCIASDALAEGYWNNDLLTKEQFFVHTATNLRLYRTGDLVRFISDDCFEFLGRIDEQIKLRGFRIELSEISSAIEAIDGISEACTQVREINEEPQIIAYVVSTMLTKPEVIRQRLSKILPHYMVPQSIEIISSLPKNNNGKVDMRKLPDPINLHETHELTLPNNKRQHKILQLWKKVLKRDDIGINDTFASLGGNSLHLISLLALLKKNIDVSVRLQQLSGLLTIEVLDKALNQRKQKEQLLVPLISHQHNSCLYLLPPLSGLWENTQLLENVKTNILNVKGIQLGEMLIDLSPQKLIDAVASAIIKDSQAEVYLGAYSLGGIWITSLIEAIKSKGKQVKGLVLLDCGHQNIMKTQPISELVANVLKVFNDKMNGEHLKISDDILQCTNITDVEELYQNCTDVVEKEVLIRLLILLKHNAYIGCIKQIKESNLPVYYFAPSTTDINDEHVLEWKNNFPQLTRINVEGSHQSMLETPNNQSLFLKLEKEIKYD